MHLHHSNSRSGHISCNQPNITRIKENNSTHTSSAHSLAAIIERIRKFKGSRVIMAERNETKNILNIIITAYPDEELMEPWKYTVAAVVLFFIGFFGFFLNIFVIILMCKDMQLWTPLNIILFNLVCSDFSVSIIGNPFTLTSAIAHHWIFGPRVCIAYGFFMSILGITSITTLTVLSYERFCLVSCPFATRQLSKRGAGLSVVFIWCYSFTLTSPPLFGWGAYVREAADISCSVNWENQTANATSYIIFLFFFGFVVPVVIILYSYINIIRTMRQNSQRLGRVNRAEGRVTWMVGVMVIAFMVAWTPYAIFALLTQFGPRHYISSGMAVLPALIAKSSICYNPLIYVGMNTQFRAAWNRSRGKESVAAETTMNQITNTSSKLSTDCRFISKKKLKPKSKLLVDVVHTNLQNETLTEEESSPTRALMSKQMDFELSVIASGKTILMKSNSYKSNLTLTNGHVLNV